MSQFRISSVWILYKEEYAHTYSIILKFLIHSIFGKLNQACTQEKFMVGESRVDKYIIKQMFIEVLTNCNLNLKYNFKTIISFFLEMLKWLGLLISADCFVSMES